MGYTVDYKYEDKPFRVSHVPGSDGLNLCLSVTEAKDLSPDELVAISQWFQVNAHDLDRIFHIDHYLRMGADYAKGAPRLTEDLRELFSIWRNTDDEIVRGEAQRTINWLNELDIPEPPLPDPKRNEGWVYLLKSGTYYKIGASIQVNKRIRTLRTLPPFDINLVCTIETDDMYKLERQLHARFSNKRVNGEWFELEPDDVAYIKGMSK